MIRKLRIEIIAVSIGVLGIVIVLIFGKALDGNTEAINMEADKLTRALPALKKKEASAIEIANKNMDFFRTKQNLALISIPSPSQREIRVHIFREKLEDALKNFHYDTRVDILKNSKKNEVNTVISFSYKDFNTVKEFLAWLNQNWFYRVNSIEYNTDSRIFKYSITFFESGLLDPLQKK